MTNRPGRAILPASRLGLDADCGSAGASPSRLAVLFLVLACLMPPALAQSPAVMNEETRVNVVEVPVTVTDRAGEPIRGLGVSDFRVFDDGRDVEITYFEVVDRETIDLESSQGRRQLHPVARRHFVLLFDLTNSLPGTVARVRSSAQEFVRTGLEASDLASVVTYSVEHGFRFVTSFTSNKDLLVDAIETLGHPNYFKAGDPLLLSAVEIGPGVNDAGSLANRSVIDSEIVAYFQDLQRKLDQFDAEYRRGRLEANLDGLGELARMLDGVRGTKQVVLLTEGFDARLIHGRDGSVSEAMEEADNVMAGEVWKADFDTRYGFVSAKKHLDEMAELFRRSDVVLHAIDIRGLRSDVNARSGFARSSNESLFLMAEPTGGEVFKNANDMSENFERLVRRQEVTYVLAFHATSTGKPGTFHDLRVELADGARGTRVRHRAGYYEEAPMSDLQRTLTTADIVMNDLASGGIQMDTLVVPFPSADEHNLTVVISEIDGPSLLSGAEGARFEADLFVYAFDDTNAVVDFRHQNIQLDLDVVGESIRSSGLKFYGTLRLPPGTFAVKSLIRTRDSDRFGFERDDVVVARESDRTLLPPLLFEPEGRWVMVKALPRTRAEVPYPFHVAEESFVPAVTPRLETDSTYKLALFAYNHDFLNETIRAGVRTASGEADATRLSVVGHQPEAADAGPNKLLLSLDTSGLVAGFYHLDIALGQGEAARRMTMPFMIDENGLQEPAPR